MNSTIKKLFLNLKKEELFIKNNDHEVYHHFFPFFSPIKNKKHEKLTVSESNINSFLICIQWSHTIQTKQIVQWHWVR